MGATTGCGLGLAAGFPWTVSFAGAFGTGGGGGAEETLGGGGADIMGIHISQLYLKTQHFPLFYDQSLVINKG